MTNGKMGDGQREEMMERRVREMEWSVEVESIDDECYDPVAYRGDIKKHYCSYPLSGSIFDWWRTASVRRLLHFCLNSYLTSESVGAIVYLFHCNVSNANANFHMNTTELYAGTQNVAHPFLEWNVSKRDRAAAWTSQMWAGEWAAGWRHAEC